VDAIDNDIPSDDELAERHDVDAAIVADSPFVLTRAREHVFDKRVRIRAAPRISHNLIREPDVFAPVVDALAGH
jgi:hypothetical protein